MVKRISATARPGVGGDLHSKRADDRSLPSIEKRHGSMRLSCRLEICWLIVVTLRHVGAFPNHPLSLSIGRRRCVLRPATKSASGSHRNAAQRNLEDDIDMVTLERQVLESAQAQLDVQRVLEALQKETRRDPPPLSPLPNSDPLSSSNWKIALAAASVSFVATYYLLPPHSILLSCALFLLVLGVAWADGVSGAVARMLGRSTLQVADVSRDRLALLARAVLLGQDEIADLRRQVRVLTRQVEELELYKARRLWVDQVLPTYSLEQLKELARERRVPVGGTKGQLLMRLLEAHVIRMDEDAMD